MRYSEEQLTKMASPISHTEDEKCKNAIRMIREALSTSMNMPMFNSDSSDIERMFDDTRAYSTSMYFNRNKIKIFVQGSYANRTNVRQDSDVDVAIMLCDNSNRNSMPGLLNLNSNNTHTVGIGGGCFISGQSIFPSITTQPYNELEPFKKDIVARLSSKFGDDIKVGNKSIKIKGNTYRVNADAVPCIEYISNNNKGVYLYDGNRKIYNYPMLHIENGIVKNKNTSRRFKRMVRIFKTIRNEMEAKRYSQTTKYVSSYGLESLLWNISDNEYLNQNSYTDLLINLINVLKSNRGRIINCVEINNIKPLIADRDMALSKLYGYFIDDFERYVNEVR